MSTQGTDRTAAAREAMRQAIEPMIAVVEGLNEEVARLEAELADARAAKTSAIKLLRAGDPQAAERFQMTPGPKYKKARNPSGVHGGAAQDAVEAWLRANPDAFPNGFMAKDLYAIRDRIGVERSMPAFNAYLANLQGKGSIRLDHLSPQKGKVFKVNTE